MLSYDSKVEYDITKFIPVKPLPMTVFNYLTCNALQLLHALYVIVHINLPISSALVSKVTQNASTGPWFFYHSPSSLHLKWSTHTQERTERDWFIHTTHGIYFKSIQKGPSLKICCFHMLNAHQRNVCVHELPVFGSQKTICQIWEGFVPISILKQRALEELPLSFWIRIYSWGTYYFSRGARWYLRFEERVYLVLTRKQTLHTLWKMLLSKFKCYQINNLGVIVNISRYQPVLFHACVTKNNLLQKSLAREERVQDSLKVHRIPLTHVYYNLFIWEDR